MPTCQLLLRVGKQGNGKAAAGEQARGGAKGNALQAVADSKKEARADLQKTAPRSAAQVVGKSEGGPGLWQKSPTLLKGAQYQEKIAGVQRGVEYDVPYAGVASGKVRFDGYDAERKVLLDAKDWDGYPPKDTKFWNEDTLRQATRQVGAADGIPIEWHFSTQESLDAVKNLFDENNSSNVTLKFTPKY